MVNIEELKPLIVERLKSLKPTQIILFGSYAYGTPNNESDIDLLITKEDMDEHLDAMALIKLRDVMRTYKIGFDVLIARDEDIAKRKDPFYQIDILQKGILLYGK